MSHAHVTRPRRYFLYDTVCCLLINHDWANFLHHVCTMLGMAVGLVQGRVRGVASVTFLLCIGIQPAAPPELATSVAQCGSELVLCLLLMEVSNPFLHWRSMLKARQTAHLCKSACLLHVWATYVDLQGHGLHVGAGPRGHKAGCHQRCAALLTGIHIFWFF